MNYVYTQNELLKRGEIIKTHIILGEFLTEYMVNTLVYLFDSTKYDNMIDPRRKIINYVSEERKLRNLPDTDVEIVSYIYGFDKRNSTFHIGIKKNNKDFVHLTLHLTSHGLNPQYNGMIHFVKDVYTTRISSRKFIIQYALISVNKIKNKSLIFQIEDGYNTVGVKNSFRYDPELQQEMDVIITVLNRMFDEDDLYYYIGNTDTVYPLHNTTNKMLHNINSHTKTYSRKTKGNRSFPKNSLEPAIVVNRVYKNKSKSTNRRATRKSSKIHK